MSKKKQTEEKKPSRFLGVYRVESQMVHPNRAVCFWGQPYLLLRIARNGATCIAQWSSSYDIGAHFNVGIYATEKEASEQAEKFAERPLSEGDWYAVLDLAGFGPREIPLDTD